MLRLMAATAVKDKGSHPLLVVVACALIDAQGRVLLSERPEGKRLAGLWEFPGGKIEPFETPEQALKRELWEEIGVDVREEDLQPLTFISQAESDFHLLMPLYLCYSYSGQARPREGQRLQWVEGKNLLDFPMPPADKPLIALLHKILLQPHHQNV